MFQPYKAENARLIGDLFYPETRSALVSNRKELAPRATDRQPYPHKIELHLEL